MGLFLAVAAGDLQTMGPAQPELHSNAINLVIGDESFVRTHGRPVPPGLDEDERIRIHLRYVEELLRRGPVEALAPALRAARARNLDRLSDYIRRGEFPRNDDHPDPRRPTFIDARGRICAVGYLLEQDMGRAAAEAIASMHKYAFLREIHSPVWAAWAKSSGLTFRELETIQPEYATRDTSPTQTFATLERVDGASQVVAAASIPFSHRGLGVRMEMFGQYLAPWLSDGSEVWYMGMYGAFSANLTDPAAGAGISNSDVGLFFVRNFPTWGRMILRNGFIVPTSTWGQRAGEEPEGAIAQRLNDATLVQPPTTGFRFSASQMLIYPSGDCCSVRIDVGADVLPFLGSATRVTPRIGAGLGVDLPFRSSSPMFAITVEGTMAWLPDAEGALVRKGQVAASVRLLGQRHTWWKRLRPGIMTAVPIGPGLPAWVLGLDLQLLVGPTSYSSCWYETTCAW
ncbi:hypothetical protein [Polyangium sorediatum]|uniref:Uncharacterized protein n=1 Tax=Polyangium sorediatum TaxID=889274 RepID=A0ABT6P5R7_9BACT|nr:hypothetical protein [Polyangium sorediatum]MDI1435949.1 hypothetical protein [Polyangium sorediatum]